MHGNITEIKNHLKKNMGIGSYDQDNKYLILR